MTRHDEMRSDVRAFHKAHPEVYTLFVHFTEMKIGQGFEHYGAKAIMERVRWESEAGAGYQPFKINNNFAAFYARAYENKFPHHKGFFHKRAQKSKETA
jgi:hypothetical protein